MIPLPYKLVFALASVLALIFGLYAFGQHRYNQGAAVTATVYEAAIATQKATASKQLADETERVRAAEQSLNDFKNTQELKDAKAIKSIADMSNRLRNLAGTSVRLRDPNAARCGGGSSGSASEAPSAPGASSADPAQADGLVSEPLSRLLLELAASADEINAAYASCRAIVMLP